MRSLRDLLRYNAIWATVRYHEVFPRFQGTAYEDVSRQLYVTVLFPFNHVVFIFLWVWQKIRHAPELRIKDYPDSVKTVDSDSESRQGADKSIIQGE